MTPDDPRDLSAELEHLRDRNNKLAQDKSYYQLILRLIELLNPLPGLDDMLRGMLTSIVECIGGTNIKVYYWVDGELQYRDFLGVSKSLPAIDDPVVARVAETREFDDQLGEADEALLREGVLRGSYTWTFPLLVGSDLIGVIKLESLHIHGASLGRYLPIFCSHAALILANEIRNAAHRRSEAALRVATERLHLATDAGIIGIFDWDVASNELVWDAAMYRLYGVQESEFGGAYEAWLKAVHPDDRAYADGEIQAALRGDRECAPEFRVIWPDGSVHYIKAASRTIRDASGKPLRMVGINYDLTERKQAEGVQRRLNRELHAISNCNQALMRADNEQALLSDICQIVCTEAGYRMAWVGYAEQDDARSIRPVAWAGVEAGYLSSARITWADGDPGRGPAGLAIASGSSVLIQDYMSDPLAGRWRDSAVQRGYRSSIALPLKDDRAETFGVLGIYSPEPAAFTPDEVRLMEELASDLAFGISVLRDRAELASAEKEHLAHLRFLEGMDKVNGAIQGTRDIEQMLGDVLDVVLSLFACDRAGLVHPCDPRATSWQVAVERAMPGYITESSTTARPMTADRAERMRRELEADSPVRFGSQGDHVLSPLATERYGIQSILAMAIRPKIGEPWEFGIHQCNAPRRWTTDDERLFEAIGRRLGDALTTLLAHRNLSDNEQKLAEAERVAHVGYLDRDLLAGRVSLSDETLRIIGLPDGARSIDLAQWNAQWLTLIHPDDRDFVSLAYAAALKDGSNYDLEYRLVRPNGEVRFVHSRGDLTRDALGKPIRMLGTVQDITERKLGEEALRAREREFRTLAENSPDVIVRYDRDCRRIYVNPEFERVNHLSAQEVLGTRPVELSSELSPIASTFQERLRTVMDTGIAGEIDLEWSKDGKPVCWFVRAVPEYDARGEVVSALTIWSNITERKLAERTIRKLNADLSATLQAIPDLLFDIDRAGTYLNIWAKNPTLLAAERDALLGHTVTEMLSPAAAETVMAALNEAAVSGSSYGKAISLELGGEARWFELSVSRKAEDEGHSDRFIVLSRDVTERKRAEEELERHKLHLEDLVAMRTHELAEARDAAESANRMKSVFLANMSHELRTPLNAILGFAQILERDTRIPEDQRNNLGAINRSGRHLLSLINDVLEISRIEAGRSTLQPVSFDLLDMLASLREFIELPARDKGLTLRMSFSPQLPRFVCTDLGKLRQVLLNLLSNAVKYTERGEIELSASVLSSGKLPLILFAVRDTGVGIAEKDLKTLFQPFYQAEYGASLGEGTGLGLSISREYAHLLGGNLSVESTQHRGSTFRFAVPVELAESISPPEPKRGEVAGLLPGQAPQRVLVVDDDADSRHLMMEILSRVGFPVRTASNGEQAVQAFQAWHPTFIWMDMRMPVLDGYEATRQIRALPGGRDTKIVALTASAFREDHDAIILAGCDESLAKPLDEGLLFATMEKLLGMRFCYAAEVAVAETAERLELGTLPLSLREALRQAADLLDVEGTELAINHIRELDAAMADQLAILARSYRYGRIAELCDEALRKP